MQIVFAFFILYFLQKSTLKNCTTKFPLENLNYGETKLITVVLDVDAEIFKKAKVSFPYLKKKSLTFQTFLF